MTNFRTLLFIALALVLAVAAPAQVTVSAPTVPNFNANAQQFPYNVYTVVVTGTGNATFSIPGFSSGTVEFFGTYSASNIQIQGANDGSSNGQFAALTFAPVAGGAKLQTFTGANTAVNGVYRFSASGITQIKIVSSATFTGTSVTLRFLIHAAPGVANVLTPPSADPCQDKDVQKVTVAISGTAPNAVKAIPLVAGKNTYVCDISVAAGTAGTPIQIKSGTTVSTPCDTGSVNLTGTIPLTVGQQLFGGWGGTVFGPPLIPIGNDVCVFVPNGTAAYGGWATVVQQ